MQMIVRIFIDLIDVFVDKGVVMMLLLVMVMVVWIGRIHRGFAGRVVTLDPSGAFGLKIHFSNLYQQLFAHSIAVFAPLASAMFVAFSACLKTFTVFFEAAASPTTTSFGGCIAGGRHPFRSFFESVRIAL